jgi:hypothetical protein
MLILLNVLPSMYTMKLGLHVWTAIQRQLLKIQPKVFFQTSSLCRYSLHSKAYFNSSFLEPFFYRFIVLWSLLFFIAFAAFGPPFLKTSVICFTIESIIVLKLPGFIHSPCSRTRCSKPGAGAL